MSLPTVTAQGKAYDSVGNPIAGAVVYYRLVCPPSGSSGAFDGSNQETESAGDGSIDISLLANAEYEIWIGRGERRSLVTTTATPVQIPALLSAQTANQ